MSASRDRRTGTVAQVLSVVIVVSTLLGVLTAGCAPKTPVASGVAASSSGTSAPGAAKAPTQEEIRHTSGTGHQPPPGSAMPPGGPKIPAQFGGKQ